MTSEPPTHRPNPLGLLVVALGLAVALVLAAWSGGREAVEAAVPRCVGPDCRSALVPGAPADDLPGLPGDVDLGATAPESLDDRARARALNAAQDFAAGPLPAASAFRLRGSTEDRARAATCLATAMLYEAGADPDGQRAVAQVVLNRVRHPAYPSNVCGVVYQGSDRRTGCQFTFTCDGSLGRAIPPAFFDAARKRAVEALDGRVFAAVGWATHYHTDWVHPVWSASLDKVARVGTHLFLRWTGWWGTGPAFRQRYAGGEAPPTALAQQSLATDPAEPTPAVAIPVAAEPKPVAEPPPRAPIERMAGAASLSNKAPPAGVPAAALRGQRLVLVHPDGGAYGLLLSPEATAEALIGVALRLCGGQGVCRVMGWRDVGAVPRGFPVPPSSRTALAFSYRRDKAVGVEGLRFDCAVWPRAEAGQCL